MESKHTKGVAEVNDNVCYDDDGSPMGWFEINIGDSRAADVAPYAFFNISVDEACANAQLIADAFNVTNETGLTPRELQKNHAELLGALKAVRLEVGQIAHNWDYRQKKYMPKVEQAIKNATK